MADVDFLFDNQLIAAVESLIKDSKHRLLLISPFIDLDIRIQDALREKKTKHDFELLVLFGKNEDNYYKSIKKDSFDFLKEFPNIEIRYNERLHAKFYQNDFDYIMTSLNLYDYSLAKNIEVGIICNFASKGLIGKAIDGADTFISSWIDKVRQDIFGGGQDVDPIEKFQKIFHDSILLYKTEPIIGKADGYKKFIGVKKLEDYGVKVDNLSIINQEVKLNNSETISVVEKGIEVKSMIASVLNPPRKTLSATQLSKALGVSPSNITGVMQLSGLINGDKITPTGLTKGLVMKNHLGRVYIAYPDNLPELNELKNKMS